MANIIVVGEEFINLDRACHIEVYTDQYNEVLVSVEYEHSCKEIPCKGTEDEVRQKLRKAIYSASDRFAAGPDREYGDDIEEDRALCDTLK